MSVFSSEAQGLPGASPLQPQGWACQAAPGPSLCCEEVRGKEALHLLECLTTNVV